MVVRNLVWIGIGVLTLSLSLSWSCNGAIVWASGGSALKGLGSLSWSCGGDGFAVGVVGGGWS